MVIATQNPIEMEGTYALPEAQRDRFMARVSMGYPVRGRRDRDARLAHRAPTRSTTSSRSPTPREIRKLVEIVSRRPRRRGRAALRGRPHHRDAQRSPTCCSAPPRARRCTWSGPPRRAAALDGRDYVLPDDVHDLAVPVLAHRLLPTVEAAMGGRTHDGRPCDRHRRRGRRCPSRRAPPETRAARCARHWPALTTRGRAFVAAGRHRGRLRGRARPATT